MPNRMDTALSEITDLEALARLSRQYGANPEFVVAGGGNTSVKSDDTLYIKPSGVPLATLQANQLIPMTRSRVRKIFETSYPTDPDERERRAKAYLISAKTSPTSSARPSVETPMHEAMDYTFVVHTHPPRVNGLTCGADGPELAKELFPDDMLWIDFIDPGHTLALHIYEKLADYKKNYGTHPHLILLQNHGMIVGADTPQELTEITDRTLRTLRDYTAAQSIDPFGPTRNSPLLEGTELANRLLSVIPLLRKLLSTGERRLVRFDRSTEVEQLLRSTHARQSVTRGTFTPDHIVYCKAKPAWVPYDLNRLSQNVEQAIIAFRTAENYIPKVIVIEQVGIFASDTTAASTHNVAALFRDYLKIAIHTAAFGGPRYLGTREVDFIDNWEVESYRRKKSKERPTGDLFNPLALDADWSRQLENKVILISGAGSGVGRVIAQGCAFMGAYPVCLDRDQAALEETLQQLAPKGTPPDALAVPTDVTDESSVHDAFVKAIRQFGGIDAVINVPSISPGGPVDELVIADYEQALKVNLLGYAIIAKYAAKVMKQQGWGVGLNMTSKSGLSPSVENNAYAATKAGEINQGYSFAAELGPYGIRWNNLALGNVFGVGSALWSDEHVTSRAKKKGLSFSSPAEAREKVRAHYNKLNALNSEVAAHDIAYAVAFMLSDKSRVMNGHTLLLDGGQTYH